MLRILEVHQYALIEHLRVEWQSGLTTLTGETGSGKSILLGALGLALGERADVSSIRKGAEKCWVEAVFDLTPQSHSWLEQRGLDVFEEITIRRELGSQGRSRAFVNDTPVNLSDLRELAVQLVDLHGQDDTKALLDRERRLDWIDGRLEQPDVIEAYRIAWDAFGKAKRDLDQLNQEWGGIDPDYLQFQLAELDALQVADQDWEALENKRSALLHADGIRSALLLAWQSLGGGNDGEPDVLGLLKLVEKQLGAASSLLPRLEQIHTEVNEALTELKEVGREIAREADAVQEDPESLARLHLQFDELQRLMAKHRCQAVSDLVAFHRQLRMQWDRWCESAAIREEAIVRLKECHETLQKESQALTKLRMKAGEDLAAAIATTLKSLHMPHARLVFQWKSKNTWDAWGIDDVDWLFSANPGSPPLPLHLVASGGERSRLMLAIKSVVESGRGVPTIVLDEIDTGVSGQVAEKMARTMQHMAVSRQVLAITHLPQVAAAGHQQWEVAKFESAGSTTTQLIPLTASTRVQAIARMLSGAEVSEAATQHAQSLLDALRSETPIQSH